MDADRLDQVLRKLIEHLDYDLLKNYETDEDTGEDTFTEEVTGLFLSIWDGE